MGEDNRTGGAVRPGSAKEAPRPGRSTAARSPAGYYNRNIKGHSFAVSDLVLRRKQKTKGMHKLSSPWEGPYVVKEVTRLGSYRLCDLDGIDIPNSWHIEHLIRFYP